MMIGVAILGTGAIANSHIEAYKKFPDKCKVVALVDVYTDKAQQLSQKYELDAEVLSDYRDLLQRKDVNLVSICLPPSLHCEAAVTMLNGGKHVLCEKPMAPTLEECDKMLSAAQSSKRNLSVVAQNRFKNDIYRTKQLLDSEILGRKYFIQANSLWWRGNNYYDLWWRGRWESEGGGCTLIHAVHHIDLFLWFMGEIKEVSSLISNVAHNNSEVEDISITTVKFANGALGSVVSSLFHHGEEQRIIIDAEKGSVELPHKINSNKPLENGFPQNDEEMLDKIKSYYKNIKPFPYESHDGQIYDTLLAIENNTQPLITGADGRRTIELISAIYQSACTGAPVTLPMNESSLFYTKEGILSKAIVFNEKKKSIDNFSDNTISVGGTL